MARRRYYLKTPGKIIVAVFIILIFLAIFHSKISALYRLLTGSGKYYYNEDFGYADYVSRTDADGDGLDDQSDILDGARRYVATRPKYKSEYYEGGWATGEYGVCTDVVAEALKAAGYDLRELVDRDIKAAPSAYDDDCGDPNIDFRRVRNLLTYFKRNAINLTTDITDCEEWQGGDIIVFEGHIGIISDRRNKNGTPLLIHHGGENGEGSRLRPNYEEDVLELRGDIVGHFRVS